MFWDVFTKLCADKETNPTRVITELGLALGSVTNWKKGQIPRITTLHKIAEYFDVPMDVLLGKEESPAAETTRLSEKDAELLDIMGMLSPEQKESAVAFLKAMIANK